MGWKIFYDALFDRELERLDRIIALTSSNGEGEDRHIKAAEARARTLLRDAWLGCGLLLEDIVEGKPALAKIELLERTLQEIDRHAGQGRLADWLPTSWKAALDAKIAQTSQLSATLASRLEELGRYIVAWSKIKLTEPVQQEVRKQANESYAILFSLHRGRVGEVGQVEYEQYLERIARSDFGLAVIVQLWASFYDFEALPALGGDLALFLRHYLTKGDLDWERLWPKLKPGLAVLDEFALKVGPSYAKNRALVREETVSLIRSWRDELKAFQLEALKNYAETPKRRERLAFSCEKGLELQEL